MKYFAIYYEWLCLTLRYGLSDFGYTICGYASLCAMAYQTLDILYVGCMDNWILV